MCHLAEGSNRAVVYASLYVPLDNRTEHLGDGSLAKKPGGPGRSGVAMKHARRPPAGRLAGTSAQRWALHARRRSREGPSRDPTMPAGRRRGHARSRPR